MPKRSGPSRRAIVYCIVPADLAGKLHELLRGHFAERAELEVVVEQRWRDRRGAGDRRREDRSQPMEDDDRRRILSRYGRRTADRRAPVVAVELMQTLPARARAHLDRLVFVERLEPSHEELEDRDTAQIVAQFQAGDRDAFARLYMRYYDRIYGYLRVVYRNPHDAEDAAQHVFMRTLQALPRYRLGESPFPAWLFRIARNYTLDDLKHRNRLEPTDPADLDMRRDEETVDPPLALSWISDREVLMFVERLPLAQREVLMLRYMLDLSTAEIAGVLDRSADDVRALHSRGLRFLRARLDAIGRTDAQGERARMRGPLRKSTVLRMRRFALR